MNTDCYIDQTRCPGVQFEVQTCNEHYCMKIGNDTHPGKVFCLVLDPVPSLVFFQIHDRLPDQISSVVSGLVNFTCTSKFLF